MKSITKLLVFSFALTTLASCASGNLKNTKSQGLEDIQIDLIKGSIEKLGKNDPFSRVEMASPTLSYNNWSIKN